MDIGLSKEKNLQERKWARIYFANKTSVLIEVAEAAAIRTVTEEAVSMGLLLGGFSSAERKDVWPV